MQGSRHSCLPCQALSRGMRVHVDSGSPPALTNRPLVPADEEEWMSGRPAATCSFIQQTTIINEGRARPPLLEFPARRLLAVAGP